MLVCSSSRLMYLFVAAVFLLMFSVAAEGADSAKAKFPRRVAGSSPRTDSANARANLLFSKKLLDAVFAFQQLGLTDYKEAISRFGTTQAVRKFDQFNQSVFPISDQTNSWAYFFNTSVFVFGSPHPPRQVVAFYHPWSDVFLLMDWAEKNGRFWVTDAEIVAGDRIRNEGPASINPTPSWLLKTDFGSLNLGISVGQTIAAFEKIFVQTPTRRLRGGLPSLKNDVSGNKTNYELAASRLLYFMTKIEALGEPQNQDDKLSTLWSETYRVVDQAAEGHWDELFQTANKTLPTTRYFLKKLSPETYRSLVIADYYIRDRGWLVFLVPAFDAGYCFSLSFEPDEQNQISMKRIDFISYSTFYDNYKKRAKKS